MPDGPKGAVIVTGAGEKAFVAGADISQMQAFSALDAQRFSQKGIATMRSVEELGIPAIALVNGYALGGGCELAMACTLRMAAETARLGQPEIALGLLPGERIKHADLYGLQRRIGRPLTWTALLTVVGFPYHERIIEDNDAARAEEGWSHISAFFDRHLKR